MAFHDNGLWEESVSAVTATPSVELGCRRTDSGNDYVYVYNGGGSQITQGYGAVLTACSNYTVSVSSAADARECFLGVAANATLTTATYGWLMTRGFAKLQLANTQATGIMLCVGANGANATAPASSATDTIFAKVVSGGTSTALRLCYVDCGKA